MKETGKVILKEVWIDIGDKRECPDCKALSGKVETPAYWDETGRPRSRNTVCGGNCRCMLVPEVGDDNFDREKLIDQVVDEYMGKVIIDKAHGGRNTVILKDFEKVEGLSTLPYSRIVELENLIFEYKKDGKTLPAEYYILADVDKQIEWLGNHL